MDSSSKSSQSQAPAGSAGLGMMDITCGACNSNFILWSRFKVAWCSHCQTWSWPDSAQSMGTLIEPSTQGDASRSALHKSWEQLLKNSDVSPTLSGTSVDKPCASTKQAFKCRLVPVHGVIDLTVTQDDEPVNTPTNAAKFRKTKHSGVVGVFSADDVDELRLNK